MKSNLGVQLYPVVLLMGGIVFYTLNAFVQCGFCFVLSFLMWCVLLADNIEK